MTNRYKGLVWNFLASGLPKDYDIEILRRKILVNIMSFLSSLALFILGTFAFYQDNLVYE